MDVIEDVPVCTVCAEQYFDAARIFYLVGDPPHSGERTQDEHF